MFSLREVRMFKTVKQGFFIEVIINGKRQKLMVPKRTTLELTEDGKYVVCVTGINSDQTPSVKNGTVISSLNQKIVRSCLK